MDQLQKIKKFSIITISFLSAVAIGLGIFAYQKDQLAKENKRAMEYSYQRAMSDLSYNMDNIEKSLQKSIYASTAPQQQGMAARLLKDSSSAKAALAQLPLADTKLDNINKFISQVGDYANFLSSELSKGTAITTDKIEKLNEMHVYAKVLSDSLKDISTKLLEMNGTAGITEAFYNTLSVKTQENQAPDISNGFKEMDETLIDYPSLIYDGPFSDHVIQMQSKMLNGKPYISRDEARDKAAKFLNVNAQSVLDDGENDGNLPVYRFKCDTICISVTKAEGNISYMLNSRSLGEQNLKYEEASKIGRDFLNSKNMSDMVESYYVISNGVCTINYAYKQSNIICYSDLVKLSIALDSGDVVSFNAIGYLMNHIDRQLPENMITSQKAKDSVSKYLSIEEESLAFIPTYGFNDSLCYEFLCNSPKGEEVLVYINTQTAMEERILILLKSDGGILVK